MRFYNTLALLLLLILAACGSSGNKEWRVGVDPSWYPLQMNDRSHAITAFSTELLTQIGQIEKVPFAKVTVSWDNLMLGLQKGKYGAILSSMPPYLFNQKEFEFSSPYLELGPVLVVAKNSPLTIEGLKDKIVAVINGSGDELLVEKTSGVIIRHYPSIPLALQALVEQKVDAALIDDLSARAYCRDLFQEKLAIASSPLTDYGLRLIAPHGEKKMVETFNRGLSKLKSSGEYDKLLSKWGL